MGQTGSLWTPCSPLEQVKKQHDWMWIIVNDSPSCGLNVCERCNTEGYWCELDVDGVIEGQLALQIHQLSVVPTLSCLHHILYVEHPWLSAVRHNHHTQVWQPGRPKTGYFGKYSWSEHLNLTLVLSNLELLIMPIGAVSISGQISLNISQKRWVLKCEGQTTALHWTCIWQVRSVEFMFLLYIVVCEDYCH